MRSSIWKGSISFGLLNIPVSLQTAQEEKELHFSMLDEHGLAPIKFKRVNAETGREVPYERIVKGYEYEKGRFVIMSDEDFRAANVRATQAIDIEDFVPVEDIDVMLFEKPYYLAPQKNGEKGYFLLRDALEKTGKVAIGKIVIRTKQHLVAVMPRGDYLICEILRFAHEVIEVNEAEYLEDANTRARYSPKELKMAEQLIRGMTGKWEPDKYKDTYYDDLMKRIRRKAEKGGVEVEPAHAEKIEPTTGDTDLLALLRESLGGKKGKRATAGRGRKSAKAAHRRPAPVRHPAHERRH